MNPPQVYTCSPSWTTLPPPSPYHPSGLSQCNSPKHPDSCIESGLATRFIYDIIHVSMPFSHIIPLSPSPTESKRLFYTTVSLLLSRIQGYRYYLSKFHIYAIVNCIDVFLSGLLLLGAGALRWPRGMVRGGRREGGSGWGTRVYLWQIHVVVWQNQYNIVK